MTKSATRWPACRIPLRAVMFALAVALPHAESAQASEHAAPEADEESDDVSEESASGLRAVKLGEFKIRTSHTVSSRKDGVSFVLHATVEKNDFEAFEHLYANRKQKVRDQVVIATRLVPIEDYDDPKLEKFRRRILLRLRRTLPELSIGDVYISDFSLNIQSI